MESTTKTNTRTLKIDGMTGDVCIQKVKTALQGVAGVTTESVRVGSATIKCATDAQCDAACAAVSAAGYKATAEHASGSASANAKPNANADLNANAKPNANAHSNANSNAKPAVPAVAGAASTD